MTRELMTIDSKILLLTLLLLTGTGIKAQTAVVDISNIRNNKGVIRLAVFTCEQTFREEIPLFEKVVCKNEVEEGKLNTKVKLPHPGTYGIALLDDENENKKLDYRFLRPDEGIGFSNYQHKSLRRPHFNDFCFEVTNNSTNKIEIVTRYY